MNLYYENKRIFTFNVLPDNTIQQMKISIGECLRSLGITTYTIRMFFSDNSELGHVVFNSNIYDKISFNCKKNYLIGGRIYVITQSPTQSVGRLVKIIGNPN